MENQQENTSAFHRIEVVSAVNPKKGNALAESSGLIVKFKDRDLMGVLTGVTSLGRAMVTVHLDPEPHVRNFHDITPTGYVMPADDETF